MVVMRQFKLRFLMGLSAAAVMANLDGGFCTAAYDQVVGLNNQIASLLGGSQGIRKDSTPVERTNLTHIAIHLALTSKADGTLKTLCGNSQAILSQSANAPLAEHFKILIVLYFATRALQGTGDLYAVPVQVVEAIKRFSWGGAINGSLLADIKSLTPGDIGQILTAYRFATIYDHIRQHPGEQIDGMKALDYAETALQMGPPTVSRAPSLSSTVPAPPPPPRSAPPPPLPPPSRSSATPAATVKVPADIEALKGQLDASQHSKLVADLKKSSILDVQTLDSPTDLRRKALIQKALDVVKPAVSGGEGDMAAQAAAARQKMKKSAIPAEESREFWKIVRKLIPDAKGKISSMGTIRATEDLLKALADYIGKYKGDALNDLKKLKADLIDLRKIEGIKDILDGRVEALDFQGIIDDLPAVDTTAAKKDDGDW